MDFTKFDTQKQVNKVQFEKEIEQAKPKLVIAKLVQNSTLPFYKKVYQYCDYCKTEVNFNIIDNKVECMYCQNSYQLTKGKY